MIPIIVSKILLWMSSVILPTSLVLRGTEGGRTLAGGL